MNLAKISEDYIEEFERTIILKEDGSEPYELKVQLKQNARKGIHIKLPKIKEAATYLQQNYRIAHPPKDCDAIIVDPENKLLYLIEMKRTSNASKDIEITEQLNAGLKWWQHISFCIDDNCEYEIIKIAAYVENRVSRQRRVGRARGTASKPSSPEFHKTLGKSIKLDSIIS